MPKRIKELNAAYPLSDSDVLAVDQSNQTAKETLGNIKDYIAADVIDDVNTISQTVSSNTNSLDTKADKSVTYTRAEVDDALDTKADKSVTYTRAEVDDALDTKADKSIISTGSTTARSIPDRFADVINVKDFGAVGNGSVETTVVQAALDAGVGKVVVFDGSATYRVGQVTFPDNSSIVTNGCVFEADGSLSANSSTVVVGSSTSVDQIKVSIPTGIVSDRVVLFLGDKVTCGYVEVISVDQQANYNEGTDGAVKLAASSLDIGQIYVSKFDAAVILSAVDNINITSVKIEYYCRGIYCHECNYVNIQGADIDIQSPNATTTASGYNGLLIDRLTYSTFSNFKIKYAGEHGARIGGAGDSYNITFENFFVYKPEKCGIKVRPSAAHNVNYLTISNPTCIDCGSGTIAENEDGILLERVIYCDIDNPKIYTAAQSVSCHDGINLYKVSDVTITGGQIFDTWRSGIYLKSESTTDDPLVPEYSNTSKVYVSGTRVTTTGQAGITVDYSNVTFRHINISAHVIASNTYGIEFINSGGGTIGQPCYFDIAASENTTGDVGGSGYHSALLGVQFQDTVFSGYVGSDGTTGNDLPDGFSVSYVSTGVYDITHGFGINELSIVPTLTPYNTNTTGTMLATSTTTVCRVSFRALGTAALTDTGFFFELRLPNRNRP